MNFTTKPKLYLVGAPKAGSSALGNFLAQHPEISVSRIKEPNFHCKDFNLPKPKTEQEYLSLFTTTSETKILADASILYLYSKQAASEIAKYCPEAYIVIILRNPIDSVPSWHSQMVFTANEPITDLKEALNAESKRKQGLLIPRSGTTKHCPALLYYREIMNYAPQIQRYQHVFPDKQILIVFYDEFKINPDAVYQKIIRFLGIDENFRPNFKTVNPSKVRRNLAIHFMLKKIFAEPARLLPIELRLKLINFIDRINSRQVVRDQTSQIVEQQLRSDFKPKIRELENLLNIDLSNWYH